MYTRDQVIDEIKRITEKLGVQSLKERDFKKHSNVSITTVKEHFGSWSDAVEEATPPPPPPDNGIKVGESVSDEELLLELLRLYERFGRAPNLLMMNAEGRFSDRPYQSRWGDLEKAFLHAKKKYPERIKLILKKLEKAKIAARPIEAPAFFKNENLIAHSSVYQIILYGLLCPNVITFRPNA